MAVCHTEQPNQMKAKQKMRTNERTNHITKRTDWKWWSEGANGKERKNETENEGARETESHFWSLLHILFG